jgi:uncharacterized protein YdiU (UPF0061 family)
MTSHAETIDYGPYGFMERFDPNFTPNTSDLDGAPTLYLNKACQQNCVVAQLAQFS